MLDSLLDYLIGLPYWFIGCPLGPRQVKSLAEVLVKPFGRPCMDLTDLLTSLKTLRALSGPRKFEHLCFTRFEIAKRLSQNNNWMRYLRAQISNTNCKNTISVLVLHSIPINKRCRLDLAIMHTSCQCFVSQLICESHRSQSKRVVSAAGSIY